MSDDKKIGLVAGFLAGDALGAPFYAVKAAHIQQLVGGWVDDYLADPILFPDKPNKNVLPGLHSIHGQEFLAVLAARNDQDTGQHPIARAAMLLRELAGDDFDNPHPALGALRAPGKPLRRALHCWSTEYPWEPEDHFALTETSEGASTAARALATVISETEFDPIGLARLTHLKEPALMAAWTIAWVARRLIEIENPKKIDADELLSELIADARTIEDALRDGPVGEHWRETGLGYPPARFSECLSPLASLLHTGDDALAEKTLVAQAREFAPLHSVAHTQHGFAPVLVPWVLYRALGPMAPAHAVEDAVNRGGEASLAAGLIGGLIGARYGFEHLPESWMAGCLAWDIARRLTLQPNAATEDDWLAAERGWTAREEELRAPLRKAVDAEKAAMVQSAKKKKKTAEKNAKASIQNTPQGELPFAPPPQVWLEEKGNELAPWEKQRLKSERGRKRIEWKEERRRRRSSRADTEISED